MDLVLQSQAGSCPIVPGEDLNVATSLLQMSVLGLPLLLALFQFVNDHEYREPEDEISLRTFVYGIVMTTSAFMLLGFYFAAFCIISSEIGWNSLVSLLLVFMFVLFAIIVVILLIQLEQMVGEGLRYSLAAYLTAFGLVVISAFQSSSVLRVIAVILAAIIVYMGWIHQSIGLKQARERFQARWTEGKTAREEDGGMEGMESAYK